MVQLIELDIAHGWAGRLPPHRRRDVDRELAAEFGIATVPEAGEVGRGLNGAHVGREEFDSERRAAADSGDDFSGYRRGLIPRRQVP